jgi:hypothetical protein
MNTNKHQQSINLVDKDGILVCPLCGFDYNHIKRVGTELDPEGDETVIYAGTSLVFERTTGERRSAVRIDLDGECGHSWSLILQQHKGRIEIETRTQFLVSKPL